MLKPYFIVTLCIIVIFSSVCGKTPSQENTPSGTLAGKTPDASENKVQEKNYFEIKSFSIPESAVWDQKRSVWWISNIGEPTAQKESAPAQKDGNGFISQIQVSTSNSVSRINHESLKLNAPKGITIFENFLLVTDIDRLVKIDCDQHNAVQIYDLTTHGASFLNDVVVDKQGIIYISDSSNGQIYRIQDEVISVFKKDGQISSPNGLFLFEEKLYCINLGDSTIWKISTDGTVTNTKLQLPVPGGDGIYVLSNQDIFASSWEKGECYRIAFNKQEKIFGGVRNAADFGLRVLESGDFQIAIPTFFGNSVVLLQVKK